MRNYMYHLADIPPPPVNENTLSARTEIARMILHLPSLMLN